MSGFLDMGLMNVCVRFVLLNKGMRILRREKVGSSFPLLKIEKWGTQSAFFMRKTLDVDRPPGYRDAHVEPDWVLIYSAYR